MALILRIPLTSPLAPKIFFIFFAKFLHISKKSTNFAPLYGLYPPLKCPQPVCGGAFIYY